MASVRRAIGKPEEADHLFTDLALETSEAQRLLHQIE